jgi:phosphate transport system substrate-binding protein
MKPLLPIVGWAMLVFAVTCARAQDVGSLPPYEAGQSVSGTIRVWGSEAMRAVVQRWQAGFQKHHPNARIETDHTGTDVAVAGLYTGSADIALMGREPTASEIQAFEWIFRYKPSQVEIMNGSLDGPGKSPALVVFVHKDNPLSKLTLAQLDAIFGHEHRRGLDNLRIWGQLGLRGDWANRPINLYARDITSGTGRYFRRVVLNDSRNMNWDHLQEFSDTKQPDGSVKDADRQILDRLAKDRFGIAVSCLHFVHPQVKGLALAAEAGGPFVEATRGRLMARQYPLGRTGIALINRAPGQAVDPKVREFLSYILSRDGQAEIVREGDFLPLDADAARRQSEILTAKVETLPPTNPASIEAGTVAALPRYQPEQSVSGVIRIQGHGHVTLKWMERLLTLWEKSFQRFHPGVTIQQDMKGTSSAIPSLFTGAGDIAILGEEIDPVAADAFQRVKGYPPLGIDIATGSLDVRNFDYAQQFFVHKDNPVSQLTLAQLDGIFGMEHRRGPKNIRTWGELGLTAEWADKPINPYGWRIDDSFGVFLQHALLKDSHRWNNALKDYVHIYNPGGTIYDHGQQILDALRADRYGIAVSNIRYANGDVKPIALGLQPEGTYYHATKETLINRTYPLTRLIPAVIDRQPNKPIDAKVKEFLRYLLSQEGQEVINQDGRYLPISKETAAVEMRKLD